MKFDIKLIMFLSTVMIPLYGAEGGTLGRVASVGQSELESIYHQPFTYPNATRLGAILDSLGAVGNERNVQFVMDHADKKVTVGKAVTTFPVLVISDSQRSNLTAAIKEVALKKKAYLQALLPAALFATLEHAKVLGRMPSAPLPAAGVQ